MELFSGANQRFSLQPMSANKSVDKDAKLMLPSQLLTSQHSIELPKIEEKMNTSSEQQVRIATNINLFY